MRRDVSQTLSDTDSDSQRQSNLAQKTVQRCSRDTEMTGGLTLVAVGDLESLSDDIFVELAASRRHGGL